MADALRYLTERDVVSVLDIPRAIDALHDMLIAQGRDCLLYTSDAADE